MTKKKIGRPVEPVPADMADAIIAWLVEGKSLTSFCAIPGHPRLGTVQNWREKDPSFRERFARAREQGAEALVDMAQDVADTPQPGEIVTDDPEKGRIVRTEDMLGHRKLRVETLLKRAANFCPSKFGTKVGVHGGDGGPVKLVVSTGIPAPEPESES